MSGAVPDEDDQPRLFEFRMDERSAETLVVAQSNRDAALLLANWRGWPSGALALTGPAGAGKTHLALSWAAENGARIVPRGWRPEDAAAAFAAGGGRVLVDPADRDDGDLVLVRLLDLARAEGGAVLLTGRISPARWPAALPDLRSRLAALAVAQLREPDREHLAFVLKRLCRERFIELGRDSVAFLVENMNPSFAMAHAVAEALDGLVLRGVQKGRKPVGLAAARKALLAAEEAVETAPDMEEGP